MAVIIAVVLTAVYFIFANQILTAVLAVWYICHLKSEDQLKKCQVEYWVMEPVRGGQLAKLSDDATAKLKAARPDEDVPAWAFRFLQSFPSVKVTLSGMSNMDQLEANIKTYEENKSLSDAEMKLILGIADDMISKNTVPCTGCHYCVSKCTQYAFFIDKEH